MLPSAVLAAVLDTLLKLLHPVMPFVTEVLWKQLTAGASEADGRTGRAKRREGPGRSEATGRTGASEATGSDRGASEATGESNSLVVAQWPTDLVLRWIRLQGATDADLQKLVTEVRRFRSDQGLADRQKVPARLAGVSDAGLGAHPRRGGRAGLAQRYV